MPKILPKFNQTILTKNFVSISKAAKFLQVSPDTLRNWEKDGKLLPSRTHGGARRYSRSELLNLKKEVHPVATRKRGLVSISVAAKSLQVSPDTLRNWDKKGLIESTRSKGGSRRFTRDEIKRLQKELGVGAVVADLPKEPQALAIVPKSSQETHNFRPSWLRIILPATLVLLLLASGWFSISYINPLQEKVDKLSSLVGETVKSIETLQRGVLGMQIQPAPSPISLPSNINTNFANSTDRGITLASAQAPLSLNSSSGQIGCTSCLTLSSEYVSMITNSDGTISIDGAAKTPTISLSLDHSNNWIATQAFQGGIGIGNNAPSQLFQLNGSASDPIVMTSGGNVGIGITSPVNKLEVAGAQTIGSGYAGAYTAPSNGLLVQGNVGIGTSAPSFHLDVVGGARFGCGDSNWTNGPATDCSDIAEAYQSDGSVGVGEIVVAGNQPNIVTKSTISYQQNIIGVYSTSPGLLVGGQTILGSGRNLGGNSIPVALAGRVPVKVSDENGSIQVGDYLTSSSIPGVAMKATKPGKVVGQALEPFDFVFDEATPSGSENTTHLVDIKLKFGRILTFVNVSFADPGNFFASLSMDDRGNLIIPTLKAGSITLDSSLASTTSQLVINNNQLTVNADPNYTSASLSAGTSPGPNLASSNNNFIDLSSEIASLEDRIKNLESAREEQNQESSQLTALAAGNSGNVGIGVTVQSQSTPTASSSAALILTSPQITPSAMPSATATVVLAETGTLRTADNLNLTPPDILLSTSSATLANVKVTETLSSDKLFTAQDSKISGDLSVFGKTTLANTSIAGDLVVDGTLAINGNSINVIGSPICSETKADCGILYLQSSPLAYQVDFFNGLVTIDRTGNLRAQSVIVAEFKVVANKISGSGIILAATKIVDIENTQVKPNSRILITPNTETDMVLAVTGKTEDKKFTVSVAKVAPEDIIFDWFIINESQE